MALVLTDEEQRLADWAKDALPGWYSGDARTPEEIQVFAKIFYRLLLQVQFWVDMTYVGRATDGAEVDWLDALARELGTKRGDGEVNTSLRYRLRNIQPALTVAAIEDGANQLLDSLGIAGTVEIEELPRDGLYLSDTPGDPDDAASYGFYWTPAVDALSQRYSKPKGGSVIVIIPYGLSATVRASVLNLVTKLRAAGIAAIVETKGA